MPVEVTGITAAVNAVRNAVEETERLKTSLVNLDNALGEIGLKPETRRCICQKCGKEWHFEHANYCSECGEKLQEAPVKSSL